MHNTERDDVRPYGVPQVERSACAVAAKLISISYGFPAVLTLVIVLYLIVALVYKSNEQPAEG